MNTRNLLRLGLITAIGFLMLVALATFGTPNRVANAQTAPNCSTGSAGPQNCLTITKSAVFGPTSVSFTIAVTNNSSVPATAITVKDKVPAVYTITSSAAAIQASCTVTCAATVVGQLVTVVYPVLAPGQSSQFSFTATFAAGSALTNRVTVIGLINGNPTVEIGAQVSPPSPPTSLPPTGNGSTSLDNTPVAAWGLAAVVLVLFAGTFGLVAARRRRAS